MDLEELPDDEFTYFAEGHVLCPCGTKIPVGVYARVVKTDQHSTLDLKPDFAEVWSHGWSCNEKEFLQ